METYHESLSELTDWDMVDCASDRNYVQLSSNISRYHARRSRIMKHGDRMPAPI